MPRYYSFLLTKLLFFSSGSMFFEFCRNSETLYNNCQSNFAKTDFLYLLNIYAIYICTYYIYTIYTYIYIYIVYIYIYIYIIYMYLLYKQYIYIYIYILYIYSKYIYIYIYNVYIAYIFSKYKKLVLAIQPRLSVLASSLLYSFQHFCKKSFT